MERTRTGKRAMAYHLQDLRDQRLARDPQRMLANLQQDFPLRFSVGIWYFTPGGGRFHDRFVPEATVEERLQMAAAMAPLGVTGIEAHYPAEVNETNAHLYRRLREQHRIRLAAPVFTSCATTTRRACNAMARYRIVPMKFHY